MRSEKTRLARAEQRKRYYARYPDKAREKYRRRHPPKPDRPCSDCGNLTGRGPLAIRCLKCWRISVKLKDKWGLTRSDYDRMLTAQNHACAICAGPPNGKGKFHVDHDHRTGAIRGLLCAACNMGIGQLRDDPDILYKAAEYLTRHARGPTLAILGIAESLK